MALCAAAGIKDLLHSWINTIHRGIGAISVATVKRLLVVVGCGAALTLQPFETRAQDKFEREKRVKTSSVPAPARDWFSDAFESVRSPRWYQEISESGHSYEAKFKWRGHYYSVEFDPAGAIQDIEVELTFEELPTDTRQSIVDYFSSSYRSHDIKRIQIQYTGFAEDLEDFIDEDDVAGLTVRYEIEYTGADSEAPSTYWEGLFDEAGKLIRRRKVILPPTDNLIF
jgi:hypothetical protein